MWCVCRNGRDVDDHVSSSAEARAAAPSARARREPGACSSLFYNYDSDESAVSALKAPEPSEVSPGCLELFYDYSDSDDSAAYEAAKPPKEPKNKTKSVKCSNMFFKYDSINSIPYHESIELEALSPRQVEADASPPGSDSTILKDTTTDEASTSNTSPSTEICACETPSPSPAMGTYGSDGSEPHSETNSGSECGCRQLARTLGGWLVRCGSFLGSEERGPSDAGTPRSTHCACLVELEDGTLANWCLVGLCLNAISSLGRVCARIRSCCS